MRCYLGIDLGGTNTRLGLVNSQGLMREASFKTRAENGPQDWLNRLASLVVELTKWAQPQGIETKAAGLGAPGRLERDQGVIVFSPNLPAFNGYPLRDEVSRALNLPTLIENDANAFTFGEHRFGAGKGRTDLACYTLGTGVGGGLVLNGQLIIGPLGIGGELGHVLVDPGGRPCPCGGQGCLEAYASATGIKAMLTEALVQGDHSTLEADSGAMEIARAAQKGDSLAGRIMATAGRALGRAASSLVVVTGIDLIVFGGGVSLAWHLLEPVVRREIGSRLKIADHRLVSLMVASLGDQAPVLGAAALAQTWMESQT